MQRILATKQPLAVEDAEHDSLLDIIQDVVQLRQIKSILILPLLLEGEVIGTIGLDTTRERRAFAQEDIELAQLIANQISIAIQNARLFETVQRRAQETATLCDFGVTIGSTLNLDEVVDLIPRELGRLVNVSNFRLALYDEDSDELHVKVRYDDGHLLPPCVCKLKEEKGFTQWVVRNGQPLLIKNWDKERGNLPVEPITVHGPPSQSWLGVPMKTQNRVVGVMVLHSHKPYAFDEATQRLLFAVANPAAIALENARLYEEHRDLAVMEERSRIWHELHDSITQNLSSIKFSEDFSNLLDSTLKVW